VLRSVWSISSLLGGMGILLSGSGLLGILLGLRGAQEQFDNLTLGVVMSAFYIGYMAGAWICPPLILRVGHIRAFASFAASAAAISLIYGLAVGPVVWWCLRILNGIMIMGIYMVIESWLNERAQTGRAGIFALYMMINLTAIAIGQYLVVIQGTAGMGSFALAAILFCLGLLPIALTPLRQPEPIQTPKLSLRKLFRAAPTGVAGALGSGLVLGSFWALSAIYARSLGLDNLGIANFTASAIVGGALLQWPIGWLSDRRDRREVLVWVCVGATFALAGLGVVDVLAGHSPGPFWYMPLTFAIGAFIFSIYGLAVAQTHDRFPPSEALEATKGLLLLHGIGAASGPLLCGGIMQLLQARGFPIALSVVTITLGLFCTVRIRRDPPLSPVSRGNFVPVDQSSPGGIEPAPRAPAAAPAPAPAPAAASATPAAAPEVMTPEVMTPEATTPEVTTQEPATAGTQGSAAAGRSAKPIDLTTVEDAKLLAETKP
jgi:MFS family permease